MDMKKRFFLKKKKLNNQGMAMVMTIVVVGIVAIFASVVMSLALVNYKMKATERSAKMNFYSAEEVLDQIHIGLEGVVSAGINGAYSKAMQTYKVDSFTSQYREAQFKLDYMSYVVDKLSVVDPVTGSKDSKNYSHDFLVGLLSSELKAAYDAGSLTISTVPSGTDNMISTTQGLVLKGLEISYRTGDFYSEISTDISIGYPDVELNEATVLPNVFAYSIIAKNSLVFDGIQSGNDVLSVKGNLYAGDKGIALVNSADVEISDVNYVVSSGEANVIGDTVLSVNSDNFWTKGICVDGSGSFTAASDIYVQDDLTIKGKNAAKVTLAGNYYGYGDGKSGAGDSSAILLNCKNATLNMEGLDELLLCGNAYINAAKMKIDDNDVSETALYNVGQVMLGSSVAMKTDQMAFLAPVDCLGTQLVNGKLTVLVGRNPMTSEEYNRWFYDYSQLEGYKKLDTNVITSTLHTPLSVYGLNASSFQTIFKTLGSETICYVYLKFDSEEQAEKYYRDYMTASEDGMKKYFERYNNKILFDEGNTEQLTGGALLTYNNNEDAETLEATITSSMNEDDRIALEQRKNLMTKNYAALCSKLTTNYNGLTELERTKDVYDNLILQTAVENVDGNKQVYTLNGMNAVVVDNNDEGGLNYDAYMVGNGAHVSEEGKACKLLIASGDVIVEGSFEGLIIAGGTVTVMPVTGSGVNLGADEDSVNRLLNYKDDALGGLTLMETYFVEGAKYVLKGNGSSTAYLDVESVITYLNWTKK